MAKKCHVCLERLDEDSILTLGSLVWNVRSLVRDANGYSNLSEGNRKITDAITREYYRQFPEVYKSSPLMAQFEPFDPIDLPKDRFKQIDGNPIIDKYVGLLSHQGCFYEEGLKSSIPLSRLNKATKALDWMFHMKEKPWFNPYGFIVLMEDLFPRIKGKA